jgi:hypothetical protein
METPTRFDLTTALREWHQEMATQPGFSSEDRRELASHLLELMDEFQATGLTEEQAFRAACQQVGEPHQLSEEFLKADPTKIPSAEWLLCPVCQHENHPDIKCCLGCGAPLGATAAWGPWEQTQAQGFAIRQATTTERPRKVLVIGVWLLFFPVWLGSAAALTAVVLRWQSRPDWAVTALTFLGQWLLATALLYRCTINYLRHNSSPARSQNDSGESALSKTL